MSFARSPIRWLCSLKVPSWRERSFRVRCVVPACVASCCSVAPSERPSSFRRSATERASSSTWPCVPCCAAFSWADRPSRNATPPSEVGLRSTITRPARAAIAAASASNVAASIGPDCRCQTALAQAFDSRFVCGSTSPPTARQRARFLGALEIARGRQDSIEASLLQGVRDIRLRRSGCERRLQLSERRRGPLPQPVSRGPGLGGRATLSGAVPCGCLRATNCGRALGSHANTHRPAEALLHRGRLADCRVAPVSLRLPADRSDADRALDQRVLSECCRRPL